MTVDRMSDGMGWTLVRVQCRILQQKDPRISVDNGEGRIGSEAKERFKNWRFAGSVLVYRMRDWVRRAGR